MGALAEAQTNRPPRVRKGPPCTVGIWLQGLDDETRAEALSMMADPAWQSKSLAGVFKTLGLDAEGGTVARHRRGDCKNCG